VSLSSRERSPSSRTARWDRLWLALAIAALALLYWRNALLGSRVIDGTRYFTLDDDVMVSMRYGRNLAEGHGLVWNPGERVEGYSNFLWTVIAGAAHLLPVADAKMSLFVIAISFLLLAATLYLALRMARVFAPSSYAVAPLLLITLITCNDVLSWAVWGFETALLSFLVMLFLVCLFERRALPLAWIALSLVPLVRADALYLFTAAAAVALVLAPDRRRAALVSAAALAPFVAHLLWRLVYYGDWLPNTYYLKLFALDDRWARGAGYVGGFLLQYGVLLALAAGAAFAIVRPDRRAIALFLVVPATLAYAATTGGDIFDNFRFFAPVLPLVFVFAALGATRVARNRLDAIAWGLVLLVVTVPFLDPVGELTAARTNGDPHEQLQVAALINKNSRPHARVAVLASGIVPYFTRRPAVDLLGKNDKHVARLTPLPRSLIGHGKIDPGHSLRGLPDLVVSYRSDGAVRSLSGEARLPKYVFELLSSDRFRRGYRDHAIEERFLLVNTAVYTRPGSPEFPGRAWSGVRPAR
jgi:hypothetical protein